MLKTLIGICLGSLIGRAIRLEDGYTLLMAGTALVLTAADAWTAANRRQRA